MVEGSGLENRRYASIRGFESHSLRQITKPPNRAVFVILAWNFAEWDSNKTHRPRREAGEGLRENWFARQIARAMGACGISAEMSAIWNLTLSAK